MVDYIITKCHYGFSYMPMQNVIELGKGRDDYSKLTDDEVLIFVSDSITHEFLHYLIHKEFNLIVSKLFDIIGHLFYIRQDLVLRLCDKPGLLTWQQYIEKNGIQSFYNQYNITIGDLSYMKHCNL